MQPLLLMEMSEVDRVSVIVGSVALLPAAYIIWFGLRGGPFFTECRWRSWGKIIDSDIYAAMLEWFHQRFGPMGVRLFMIGFGAAAAVCILIITWLNLTRGPGNL